MTTSPIVGIGTKGPGSIARSTTMLQENFINGGEPWNNTHPTTSV